MPILNNLGEALGVRRDPFPRESMFALTPFGQQKAHAYDKEGPELAILTILDEGGPSDINEIQRKSGFDNEKCKLIIRKMIRQNLVKQV